MKKQAKELEKVLKCFMSGSAGGLHLWGGEGLSRRSETKHLPTLLGPYDDRVIKTSRLVQIINMLLEEEGRQESSALDDPMFGMG